MTATGQLTVDAQAPLAHPDEYKDLLPEILPPQGSWSEEKYLVLTDHRNRFIEYTDGYLEFLPWPTQSHQMILGFLFIAFANFFDRKISTVLFGPLRLQIRLGKFREPDLLLMLSATDQRRQNRFWLGADIVLEVVHEDKPERDIIEKRSDYAEGRVPEYWIVNPMTQTINVLMLRGDTYVEAGIYKRGECTKSSLVPDFSVSVTEIFDAG